MSKVEALEAQLAMEKAAEKFVAAKAANDGTPAAVKKYREAKVKLGAARTHWRLNHRPKAPGPGGAIAAPAAIGVEGNVT